MAIKQASEKVLAVVETISKPKPSQYGSGMYQSVLFLRYDREGDEAKVWQAMGEANAKLFRKGMQVYLAPVTRDGKQSWDVEVIDAATPSPGEQSPAVAKLSGLTPDQKNAIAEYATEQIGMMRFLWDSVADRFKDCDISEESIRAISISMYIQVQKKFDRPY